MILMMHLDAKIAMNGDADVDDSIVTEKGNVTTCNCWEYFENYGLFKGGNARTADKDYATYRFIGVNANIDMSNAARLRGQFLRSLCNNVRQRYLSSELLEAFAYLIKSS